MWYLLMLPYGALMRVGSTKIAKAFLNGTKARTNNTQTDGTCILLHGHKIVWKDTLGNVYFSLCKWNTPTTRDRINHVFHVAGITLTVCQHKHEPYIYNHATDKMTEISGCLPYAVSEFLD